MAGSMSIRGRGKLPMLLLLQRTSSCARASSAPPRPAHGETASLQCVDFPAHWRTGGLEGRCVSGVPAVGGQGRHDFPLTSFLGPCHCPA
ncbi:hypothetical protein F5X68DRAFT_198264 [Plectosphaerella plurivora]|uniref:Uncharacterized protein n=1 Tax=Plectosphaerella plurivora TaxID=936078 RepID=A0A9P8VJ87_9PEZI|nr:hypothetical protein F5X68DRAFT_198264 [Plectosphaerella plurivora]